MPLHGTKTHALSDHARSILTEISKAPIPLQSINPGVADRLCTERLVESVMLPSPYKTHKGKTIEYLRLTPAGATIIRNAGAGTRTPA